MVTRLKLVPKNLSLEEMKPKGRWKILPRRVYTFQLTMNTLANFCLIIFIGKESQKLSEN